MMDMIVYEIPVRRRKCLYLYRSEKAWAGENEHRLIFQGAWALF